VARLAVSLAWARGKTSKGFSHEEVEKVVEWADKVRLGQHLLELVLHGRVAVDWDPESEDTVFSRVPDDEVEALLRRMREAPGRNGTPPGEG
jgi:hypothetical protein